MHIGPYSLKNNVLLAPMAGVTDRPFRQLCRQWGAGLTVSEMVTSDTRMWNTRKSSLRLDHSGEPGPISVQIAGSDPQQLAEAAQANVERGAQIIDINMGCPAKKVCNKAAGSALMANEPLVAEILATVVNAVDVPVTLKTRLGTCSDNINAPRIAELAEQNGIAALALHGRTRVQMYTGDATFDVIRAIKQAVSIPIIANGDITSPQKAKAVLDATGADAIMVGRGAHGAPWLFQQINHFLECGEQLAAPEPAAIRDTVLGHLESLYDFYGDIQGVRVARKHLRWYGGGNDENPEWLNYSTFWATVNRVTDSATQYQITKDWLHEIEQHSETGKQHSPIKITAQAA